MKQWKDNDIGDEGSKSISELLKINTSLTKLNLKSGNPEKWWKRMKKDEMGSNKKVKMKNEKWIGNSIGDEGAKSLSESLMINTSLIQLNLEGNE